MGKYYLAVDIGASSGRHILGHLENGKIELEEIYRFENGMDHKDGKLLWNVDRLFGEILNGMKKCKEQGKIPVSMAIDTWAVDYVLLDEKDRILGDTYGYRDHRTDGMDAEVAKILPETELYAKTGIQKQIFNTIYQLMAEKQKEPELLQRAETLLMLPDYFGFRLTGNKLSEYTNGSTTQLVNPTTFQWDTDLIRKLGYPEDIFLPLQMPGTKVGQLLPEIQKEVGFNEEAAVANFTNEGGYDHRFRFLKNIMGLWMIQSVRHEYKDAYSFAQLCDMAEDSRDFPSRVDVNDPSFLSPDSMVEAIKKYCQKTGQPVPESVGELASVVYRSLAQSYGETVSSLEKIAGRTYDSIHIIGGGSNAAYLNQLTADSTGKTVYAGPGEATAIGNLLAQMIYAEELTDLKSARQCVRDSFEIKTFVPAK